MFLGGTPARPCSRRCLESPRPTSLGTISRRASQPGFGPDWIELWGLDEPNGRHTGCPASAGMGRRGAAGGPQDAVPSRGLLPTQRPPRWQSGVGDLQPANDSAEACTARAGRASTPGSDVSFGRAWMNPFERGIRTIDAWQQRHRVPAFTFAVFKKFGDDQAGTVSY